MLKHSNRSEMSYGFPLSTGFFPFWHPVVFWLEFRFLISSFDFFSRCCFSTTADFFTLHADVWWLWCAPFNHAFELLCVIENPAWCIQVHNYLFFGVKGVKFCLYLKFHRVKNYFGKLSQLQICHYQRLDGIILVLFGDVGHLWVFSGSSPSFSWFCLPDPTFLPILIVPSGP